MRRSAESAIANADPTVRRFCRRWHAACLMLALPTFAWAVWGDLPDASEIGPYTRVSIVFATQNLRSPVSQFGHTFLVFHHEDDPEPSALTVEFVGTVVVPTDYVAALVGAASGHFQFNYLSNKARSYEMEDRSLWIYELDLTSDQVERLRSDLRERARLDLSYGVFRANCASYIIDELASLRGLHYRSESVLFVSPDASVRWLRSNAMIKHSRFRPSQQVAALAAFDSLSESSRVRVRRVVEGYREDETLSQEESDAVSLMIDYRILRERNDERRNALFRLKKIYYGRPVDSSAPPDPSHGIGGRTLGVLFQGADKGTVVSYRPGFIGLENEDERGFRNASSRFAQLDLRWKDSTLRVDRFDLFSMESYAPSGFLRSGFTQRLEISYVDFGPYLDRIQRESAIDFGRGITFPVSGSAFSILPFASVKAINNDRISYFEFQLACRVHLFGDLGAGWRYAATYDRYLSPGPGISDQATIEVMLPKWRHVGISINFTAVDSTKNNNATGVRVYANL